MLMGISKDKLKSEYVKPKINLMNERVNKSLTTEYLAGAIGVGTKQYILKEKGVSPFKDYEMLILSNILKSDINFLFFD